VVPSFHPTKNRLQHRVMMYNHSRLKFALAPTKEAPGSSSFAQGASEVAEDLIDGATPCIFGDSVKAFTGVEGPRLVEATRHSGGCTMFS
jgi:hypothetical protein